jgi:hypothetical protein
LLDITDITIHTIVKNVLGDSSYLGCGRSWSRAAKDAMLPKEYKESKQYHDLEVSRLAWSIEIECMVDGLYNKC